MIVFSCPIHGVVESHSGSAWLGDDVCPVCVREKEETGNRFDSVHARTQHIRFAILPRMHSHRQIGAEAMNPERGPLPPMVFPLSDEGREIYVPQRIKKWAQDYAIAYAAAEVARFIDAPSVGNWIAADDYMRNVKALDVALNGEGGAERPLLIDVLGQVEAERRRIGRPVLEVARLAGQAVKWQAKSQHGTWVDVGKSLAEQIESRGGEVRALGVIATRAQMARRGRNDVP